MAALCQNSQIVVGQVPVDEAGGAITGDWVSMANFNHITIIFVADIGTAGEDPIITVQQATTNTGTSAKALNYTEVYQKEGATAISAVGPFTRVTGQTDNTYTSATGGENEQLICIEIDADEMDVAGGFDFVNVTLQDLTTAGKLVSVLYILTEPRYARELTPSAIA